MALQRLLSSPMDRFLPVEQQIVAGAGLSVVGGHDKVVLHTTETGPGSLQAVLNMFRGNWGAGLPHFLIEGSRIVQTLPLNVNAYTLENSNGGYDTNRSGHVIQVEIVARAADGWNDTTYDTVGKWLAMLKQAGLDFDPFTMPYYPGPQDGTIASYSSRFRQGYDYAGYPGTLGHVHVPENAHWDPGPIDTVRLAAIITRYLGSTTPPPVPVPQEDDSDMITPRPSYAGPMGDLWWTAFDGTLRYIASPATLNVLIAKGLIAPWTALDGGTMAETIRAYNGDASYAAYRETLKANGKA